MATSLNVNCGIASLAVNPIEQLDVAVNHSEKGPSPSFAVEIIEASNASSPEKRSALFDLFSEPAAAAVKLPEDTQPSCAPIPFCALPVSFTITTTGDDFTRQDDDEDDEECEGDSDDSDSEASSPFNAREAFDSEAGVDILDLAVSNSGKEDPNGQNEQHGQLSPARVVNDHDDLFSDFETGTTVMDLMSVNETQAPCPPPLHSSTTVMTRPPLPASRSEEMDMKGKIEALSLEMSHSVTEVIEEECEDPQGSDEADDDLPQRREEYIKLFMRADIVYSSPLTRAVQTALAAMCGHSALTKNKLVLYR